MSQNNGFAKRSDEGLLTPDNCAVAFIDHQPLATALVLRHVGN